MLHLENQVELPRYEWKSPISDIGTPSGKSEPDIKDDSDASLEPLNEQTSESEWGGYLMHHPDETITLNVARAL